VSGAPTPGGTPSLRRTQEIFWRMITAPEGVRAALQKPSEGTASSKDEIDALFRGGDDEGRGGPPAVERLDIYANMYFYRLLDVLKEDYPRLLEAIGAGRFHNLVTDYLLIHPSKHPSLRFLGEALPGFVATHPLAGEFPWLRDLARLEWDRVEVFDGPDSTVLTRSDLARLPQEQAGEARFALIPACRVRRFDFDVARLWRELKRRAEADSQTPVKSPASGASESVPPVSRVPPVARRSTWLRIWRKDFVVYHSSIEEDEARALESLGDGAPLQKICQRLAAGITVEKATERIGRLMQGWIEDGLLASFELSPH